MVPHTLTWSPGSVEKLNLIGDYYAAEDPEQAMRSVRTLLAVGRRIQRQPEHGQPVPGLPRSFRVVSTRPFPFLVYYRFMEREKNAIVIDIRHLSNRPLKPALLRRRRVAMRPASSVGGGEQ